MPEWRDRWGEWLVLGVKAAVAVLVWSLPAIIIALPMGVGFALMGNNDSTALAGGLLAASFGCLAVIWSVIVMLATPAIYIRLAESEDLGSAFRFGEILAFTRQHLGNVIVAAIMVLVASAVMFAIGAIVGMILCVVGLLVTLPAAQFLTTMIQSHLYGQIGLGARPWETSIVPEQYIPQPPAAPSVYETPVETAVEPVDVTPENPS